MSEREREEWSGRERERMSEREWKALQQELQVVAPGPQDGPRDPQAFEARVLRAYKRRAAADQRNAWLRRAGTVAVAAAAVWMGVFVLNPTAPGRQLEPGTVQQGTEQQPWRAFLKHEESGNPATGTAVQASLSWELPAATVAKLPIPPDQRIDPTRELGVYVLNGKVTHIDLTTTKARVHLTREPGHVQVYAIDDPSVAPYRGFAMQVELVDEQGAELQPSRIVHVPKK